MTPTRTDPRAGRGVRRGLLVAAVAAVVLGILGMHGFAGHDTSGHGDLQTEMVHGSATSPTTTTGATDPDHGAPAGMGSMAMTCGVMLAAAAITVLLLLVRRSVRPRLWAVLALADAVWRPEPGVRLRTTGPPDTSRFSVIRC